MKKHAIDELFAKKLSGVEKVPSPDAWQRIAARQQERKTTRRLGGWYWYAAASVLLALTAGYLVWDGSGSGEGAANERVATAQLPRERTGPLESELPAGERAENTQVPLEAMPSPQVPVGVNPPVDNEVLLPSGGQASLTLAKNAGEAEPDARPVTKALASLEVEAIAVAAPDAEPSLETGIEGPSAPPVEFRSLPSGERDGAPSTRVLVAQVENYPPDEVSPDEPGSGLVRVLRQLKNVKQGDPVEWRALGLNPKRTIARVDAKLRNGQERVSGRYQDLKDKTKL